jgi:hypothetical protein
MPRHKKDPVLEDGLFTIEIRRHIDRNILIQVLQVAKSNGEMMPVTRSEVWDYVRTYIDCVPSNDTYASLCAMRVDMLFSEFREP